MRPSTGYDVAERLRALVAVGLVALAGCSWAPVRESTASPDEGGWLSWGDARPGAGADLPNRGFSLGAVTDRHHDVSTGCRQAPREPQAKAAARPGDDRQLAGKIRHSERQRVALGHHLTGSS